jgi:cytoskeletal protein CcmA (bactofilin family)
MSLFGGKTREDAEAAPDAATAQAGTRVPAEGPSRTDRTARDGGETVANIGKSISIRGDLTGNEDIVIEGKVEGKVDLPNNQLTIGANGTVRAEINAKAVVVIGSVAGNVNGTERVEIQATGVVEGDVAAPRLVVAEGASLNGSISMTPKEGAAAAPRPPGTPGAPPSGEVRKAG